MRSNPYTPPKSDVKDVGPERLIAERPRQVIHATLLLWVSAVLAVPLMYWEYQRTPEESAPVVLIFAALVLALVIAVNIYVWQGRNWARIIFLALAILSVIIFFGMLRDILEYPAVEIVLNIVSLRIDVVVAFLLFTKPGALWFRPAP